MTTYPPPPEGRPLEPGNRSLRSERARAGAPVTTTRTEAIARPSNSL